MNVVRVKPGVEFAVIDSGGFRILSAVDQATQQLGVDLVISSGSDGEHSGPADPHHSGNAYDVRSHDFDAAQKEKVLAAIMQPLGERFFGFLESPGTENEHFHIQVAKGTTYP